MACSSRARTINLGPTCTLPTTVLETAAQGLLDYNETGMGLVELSHRGKDFQALNASALDHLRTLLEVPEQFEILFMQGGALEQISCVVMNLVNQFRFKHRTSPKEVVTGAFALTGTWCAKAAQESIRLGCPAQVILDARKFCTNRKFNSIPLPDQWNFETPQDSSSHGPAFVYYCDNEPVHGVEYSDQGFPILPEPYNSVPLVADMSSNILSRRIRPELWNRLGLVFAAAEKNLGPSGMTVVIVRKALLINLDDAIPFGGFRVPAMLSYKTMADHQSLYNTPPMFSIYVCDLVLIDLLKRGGVSMIERVNSQKANAIYKTIDDSDGFYVNGIEPDSRSRMNVVFSCSHHGTSFNSEFVAEAEKQGIKQINGHRATEGLRVSLYNAVTLEQVDALCKFMLEFMKKRHAG